MLKAVLFDLDGTLLPMDLDEFVKAYFGSISEYMTRYGYNPKELIGAIWRGTEAMLKNDGSHSNEEVFWEVFKEIYGSRVKEDIPLFDEFYVSAFNAAQQSCGKEPRAAKLVSELKKQGIRLILATNPIFPFVATERRIRWAGLEPDDFEYITHYGNSASCKPHLSYYEEILKKTKLVPDQCLMVGNDVSDDMPPKELGMNVFLLTDCIINKDNADISVYPNGSFEQLTEYIDKLQNQENQYAGE